MRRGNPACECRRKNVSMLKKSCLFLFALFVFSVVGVCSDLAAPSPVVLPKSDDHAVLPDGAYLISPYDNIIRSVSERAGNDWRLVSAIAYHESRFRPDVVSRRGARGLMQIMPSVARQFGVPQEEVADPVTNVWLANRLLDRIDSMLGLSASVPEQERMRLVLASYNAGIGHVADARRLARSRGENPDSWSVVARCLELKADPANYGAGAVRNGRFTGARQTRAFVADVMDRYDRYCRVAER